MYKIWLTTIDMQGCEEQLFNDMQGQNINDWEDLMWLTCLWV